MTAIENKNVLTDMLANMCAYYCDGKPLQYPNCDFCTEREAIVEAIRALEKQIPKSVNDLNVVGYNSKGEAFAAVGICPNCNKVLGRASNKNYCNDCGQAIDWTEEVYKCSKEK